MYISKHRIHVYTMNTDTNTKTEEIQSHQSVEMGVTSKGLWSGKVKVYDVTAEKAYDRAYALAQRLESLIAMKNSGMR